MEQRCAANSTLEEEKDNQYLGLHGNNRYTTAGVEGVNGINQRRKVV